MPVNPLFRSDVGRTEDQLKRAAQILGFFDLGNIELFYFVVAGRALRRPLIDGRFFGEGCDGNPRHFGAVKQSSELMIVGDSSDNDRIEVPFIKYAFDLIFRAPLRHQEHPFL